MAEIEENELQTLGRDEDSRPGSELAPTDRGRAAYLALACCTIAQAPIWGYSVSFGIFQEYYSSEKSMHASPGAIATIGAAQQGVMYLMMPLAFYLLNRYPHMRRWGARAGLVMTFTSLIGSAFVKTIGGLIATQGALYAIGCGLLFSPISIYLDEWFVERKGLALGIMWAGKSGVGIVMPFVFRLLLDRFGLRPTLLAWAVASSLLIMPTLFFLRPRIPVRPGTHQARPLSFGFLKHGLFWMSQLGIMVQSLGYLMPSTYLASYASAIGLSKITGPILLALLSCSSVPGGIFMGWLGDRTSATRVVLISSFGSAIPVFLLWGLSRHISNMVVFVIIYGFFAGGFSSTWSSVLVEIRKNDTGSDTSLIFGLLMGGRGLGYVLAGPISGALVSIKGAVSDEALGYSTKYGPMILCTGITAVLGAWAPYWKAMRRLNVETCS